MEEKKSHKGMVVIAVLAVLVIIAAAGVLIYQHMKAQQEYEAEHASHSVAIDLAAKGYDPTTDSKIKIHIAGTDLDNKQVSQDVYIQSREDTFELLKGEYQLSFEASPLMASGKLFELPAPVDFVVDEKNSAPTPAVTFVEAEMAEVTDEQINKAYEIAIAGGMDEADASKLREATSLARNAALEQAQRATDERGKAIEEAKRKDSFHIQTADFEFDIPEYLWDKVNWDHEDSEGLDDLVMVYRQGHRDQPLFWVWSTTNSEDVEAEGDVATHIVSYTKKGNKYVGVSSENYAFEAAYYASDPTVEHSYSEADLKVLVDLCSGGKVSYEQAVKDGPEKVGTPDIDFYKSTVFESLVAR